LHTVSGTTSSSPRTPQLDVGLRRRFGVALTLGVATWVAVIAWVPFHTDHGSPSVVTAAVYGVGALLCHQRPERSFRGRDAQFPVCARCTGLYVGALAGAVIAWFGAARVPHRVVWILACAAMPTATTFVVELAGAAVPSNLTRAFAGLPLGGMAAWVVVRMLREPN
jgi:uncharacterized membrane protein